ncbi:MAG: molybdopterin dinucleotide binding domain-containing protein, partial [Pseudomonadota bacterium]
VLNTGRNRDQWHTMTRTALSPRLSAHLAEPYVDIHPRDAKRLGVSPADLVCVENTTGRAILRAHITDAQQPGALFAPIHWSGQTAPAARVDALVPAATDPFSGQPESKAATVSAMKFAATWYGFAISQTEMTPKGTYWAQVRTDTGWRSELAGQTPVTDWEAEARSLFGLETAELQILQDVSKGTARLAFSENGVLKAALFVSPHPVAVMRDYLATLPGSEASDTLTGRAPVGRIDPGPTICACFGIGLNTIATAIQNQNLMTVEAIGEALQAGTNCGACRPELMTLLPRTSDLQAAE